ncbi:MAG TPA: ribonuclease H-like domain-containing protein [Saprospiraceae bacterium]|nr:ribonuclease H-like domain-containing protein [Saprospiraceae bacterium]
MPKSIFIDAEWYIGGDVFLIGYCYNLRMKGQLHGNTLSKYHFLKLLKGVKYIYIYGPDVGILEKYFDINLRRKFICINILRMFRKHLQAPSYKLADLEIKFRIKRSAKEYKKNIFNIFHDWKNVEKKERILLYNMEDVINLMKIWKIVRAKEKISINELLQNRLT